MKKKYTVLVDRGFRGIPAGGTGEFDAADSEVKKNEAAGFLLAAGTEKTPPAPAVGSSEDDEKEG